MSRTIRATLIALAVAVVAPSHGWSQDKETKGGRFITATGTATLRFRADRATIYLGIRTSDPVFDAARDSNQKGTKAIEEAIAALKIRDLSITLAPQNIVKQEVNQRFGGGRLGGGGIMQPDTQPYTVTQPFAILVRETNPDKLKEACDKISKAAVDAGANTGGNPPADPDYGFYPGRANENGPRIVLSRDDDSEHRDKAFADAVKKAMRTAKAIAEGAGVKIVDTVSITETDDADSTSTGYGNGITTRTSVREIGGELELVVRVRVKCSY